MNSYKKTIEQLFNDHFIEINRIQEFDDCIFFHLKTTFEISLKEVLSTLDTSGGIGYHYSYSEDTFITLSIKIEKEFLDRALIKELEKVIKRLSNYAR